MHRNKQGIPGLIQDPVGLHGTEGQVQGESTKVSESDQARDPESRVGECPATDSCFLLTSGHTARHVFNTTSFH